MLWRLLFSQNVRYLSSLEAGVQTNTSERLAIGRFSLQGSQGIRTSKTYRFLCTPKQEDWAVVKNCIIFLPCAEIVFIFLSCERLVFTWVAHKHILKAEVTCAEQNRFLEMNEFCTKRKIKPDVSPSFVWKSEHNKKYCLYGCVNQKKLWKTQILLSDLHRTVFILLIIMAISTTIIKMLDILSQFSPQISKWFSRDVSMSVL